jgi:hypothetical protein
MIKIIRIGFDIYATAAIKDIQNVTTKCRLKVKKHAFINPFGVPLFRAQ